MKQIYFDYAAATPVSEGVLTAMRPYFSEKFYNPSATYLAAKSVRKDIEDARARIALVLGAKSSEIIFTAGGTEANNLAIHGVMRRYPGKEIVVSGIEHESVLEASHEYNYREAPVLSDGMLDTRALAKMISGETVMVSVMYANNEVGTVQRLSEIASILKLVRIERLKQGNTTPLYFHTDAAQAANYLDLHVSRLGVDMMTLNGGKIYGPKQSGALWLRSGIDLEPLIYGGGQERDLRSGTENVAGIVGFSKALEEAVAMRHDELARLGQLRELFFGEIIKNIPNIMINGSRKKRLPNNVHITIPGQDNERLLMRLDEVGILAAAGSACSASDEEPSHVLRAMGISEADARASLRFTMGRGTTEKDIRFVVRTLIEFLA